MALFKIIRATGKVYQVDAEETVSPHLTLTVAEANPLTQSWILCHILDLTTLYLSILSAILSPTPPPFGPNGFYFAENGRFKWNDLSTGIASKLGVDTTLHPATPADLETMGKILGCPVALVPISVAGRRAFVELAREEMKLTNSAMQLLLEGCQRAQLGMESQVRNRPPP